MGFKISLTRGLAFALDCRAIASGIVDVVVEGEADGADGAKDERYERESRAEG